MGPMEIAQTSQAQSPDDLLNDAIRSTGSASPPDFTATGSDGYADPDSNDLLNKALDRFCWICHTPASVSINPVAVDHDTNHEDTGNHGSGVENSGNVTVYNCTECSRTFHSQCWITVGKTQERVPEPVCVECQAIRLEKRNPLNVMQRVGEKKLQQFYLYMLRFVEEKLARDQEGPFAKNPSAAYRPEEGQEQVVSPAVLQSLRQQIVEGRYSTYAQFLGDLRGLLHRSLVVHGVDSGYTRIAVFIMETCKQLCNSMDWCELCFERCLPTSGAESLEEAVIRAMSDPCIHRHMIVSVILPHRVWPAIIYKFDGQCVFVRFFGTLEFGRVKKDAVLMLNEDFELEGPNEPKREQHEMYVKALQQCRNLISKLLKLSDICVEFFPQNTPFNGRTRLSSTTYGADGVKKIRAKPMRNRPSAADSNDDETSSYSSSEKPAKSGKRGNSKLSRARSNEAATGDPSAESANETDYDMYENPSKRRKLPAPSVSYPDYTVPEEPLLLFDSETDESIDERNTLTINATNARHDLSSRRTSLLMEMEMPQLYSNPLAPVSIFSEPAPNTNVQLIPMDQPTIPANDTRNQRRPSLLVHFSGDDEAVEVDCTNLLYSLTANYPAMNNNAQPVSMPMRVIPRMDMPGTGFPSFPHMEPMPFPSVYTTGMPFSRPMVLGMENDSISDSSGDIEQQMQSFFDDFNRLKELRRIEAEQNLTNFQSTYIDCFRRFMETRENFEQIYLQQIIDNQRLLENVFNRFQSLFSTYRATNEAFLHAAVFESGRKEGLQDKNECITATKREFWCCLCQRRAQYLCCGVTLYCSEECQQSHLAQHQVHCSRLVPVGVLGLEDKTVQTPFGVLTLCRTLIPIESVPPPEPSVPVACVPADGNAQNDQPPEISKAAVERTDTEDIDAVAQILQSKF
ncbi:uncharacterized protein LOC129587488 isoform X2 [Paramacrobiotus metropolitanus]|uniref:uncharacterized protein LOC129587488 isoform X2 n=1 Tax=Paramacrobiotus metropolitanus TaxID=2943436 RepID=UPI002445B683|nr:uncharacterized protein LOC129587488 isoform X2 [Paramacrobiotus metropolitanus]